MASLENCWCIPTDPILAPSPREPSLETPHVVLTGCGLAPCQSPCWCPTVKISGEASAKRNCRSWQCIDLWPLSDASWQISPTYRVQAAAVFFLKCGFRTALLTPRLLTEGTWVDEHRWWVKRTTELSADYWVQWKPSVNSGYDWLCPAPFGGGGYRKSHNTNSPEMWKQKEASLVHRENIWRIYGGPLQWKRKKE